MKKKIIYILLSVIVTAVNIWGVWFAVETVKNAVSVKTEAINIVDNREKVKTKNNTEENKNRAKPAPDKKKKSDKKDTKDKAKAKSDTDKKDTKGKAQTKPNSEKKETNKKSDTSQSKPANGKKETNKQPQTKPDTRPTNQGKTNTENKDQEKKNPKSTTILIYMIGSDLESRSGAGTEDMQELEKSGIDLSKNKVVIFAGGSPRWHNDITSEKKVNVLELKKDGFKAVTRMDSASMGTAKSLSEFLNYGYKNYSADSYGLIMWDHGNGPNIGYGKDMLFENDSLTLAEMKEALNNSPFNSSNKLDWVGFDACLMSTAELACVWDDYANYMVASQEIEPSFGWNYDIFKKYTSSDIKGFLAQLTKSYLSTSLDYYNDKGYSNKDITLACMDLSHGNELEKTINNLFSKASLDIGTRYDELVRKRVGTRSLGRASTGSEYDLVDLSDMATQLSTIYPEETAALTNVIKKMVIKNETNAQLCCGLSLYYPFYNKYHYEQSWADAYAKIGVFDSYQEYLNKYQKTWLKETDLEKYEKSPVPQKVADANRGAEVAGTYMLPLSPQQNANYAEAKVYILERYERVRDAYHVIMTSQNVKNIDGVLYADIIDKAIFAKDNYGRREIPVTEINDKVGDISRFTCRVTGTTYVPYSLQLDEISVFDIQFALNNATEELSISSVFPYNPPTRANEIPGGKLEDVDLYKWEEYMFPRYSYRYFTRNSLGTVLPVDEWVSQGAFYSKIFKKDNGLEFVYENIDKNTYYIIFEITDTQGGKYCSELLEIMPQAEESSSNSPEDITIDWNTGSEIEVFNSSNISLKIRRQFSKYNEQPEYIMISENKNEYPVVIELENIILNGVCAGSYYAQLEGNSVNSDTLINSDEIGQYVKFGVVNEINHIEGILKITKNNGLESITENQNLIINCSKETSFEDLKQYWDDIEVTPYKGALAESQVLYQDEKTKISLMLFGKDASSNRCYVLFENFSDKPQSIQCNGAAFNNITQENNETKKIVPPNSKSMSCLSFRGEHDIANIESMSLRFSSGDEDAPLFDTADGAQWFPVLLKESGKAAPETVKGDVVYDSHGIVVTVTDFEVKKSDDKETPRWHAIVENNSDYDVALYTTGEKNAGARKMLLSSDKVGAHQKIKTTFEWDEEFVFPDNDTEPMPSATFKIHIMNYEVNKLLFLCEEPITIYGKDVDDTMKFTMSSSEKIKVIETQDVSLCLEKVKTLDNKTTYSLNLKTYEDNHIDVWLENLCVNGEIALEDYINLYRYSAGETSKKIDLSSLYECGVIDTVDSISGYLIVKRDGVQINKYQKVKFTFTGEGKIDFLNSGYTKSEMVPFAGALAEKQVLSEDENLRITLLCFGKSSNSNTNAYICYENLSKSKQTVLHMAVSLNAITKYEGETIRLEGNEKSYRKVTIADSWMQENDIESIEEVKFFFKTNSGQTDNPYKIIASTVSLKEKGNATSYIPGENVLFDKNGVKIILNKFAYEQSYTGKMYPEWNITVINDTDNNIDLSDSINDSTGFFDLDISLSSTHVAAHQRINCKLTYSNQLTSDELLLKVILNDWTGKRIFTDDEMTSFPAKEEEEIIAPYMDALAGEQVLWETDEFRLKLLYFGNSNKREEKIRVSLENFTEKSVSMGINNIVFNSKSIPCYGGITAPAYETVYEIVDWSGKNETESIERLDLGIILYKNAASYDIKQYIWKEVELELSGKAKEFIPGTNEIFNKEGIRIILDGFKYDEAGSPVWKLMVINDTDNYINLTQGKYQGITPPLYYDEIAGDNVWMSPSAQLGPHQRRETWIHYNNKILKPLNFKVTVKDIYNNELYHDDELITLYLDDGEKFTKTK